jgi:hypothetical protein
MQYKFGASLIAREATKVATAWAACVGLVVAAVVLLLVGSSYATHVGRSGLGLGVAACSAVLYAFRLAGWAWDAQRSALWMTRHELRVCDQGIEACGAGAPRLHAWDRLRVEADGGPDLLVFEDGGIKVAVDALEQAGSFRREARAGSHSQLLL